MNILFIYLFDINNKLKRMQSIITTKNLDIETTIITNPKLDKNKRLTAAIINNKTKSALYIESPELINPFGLSAYDGGSKDMKESDKSWSLVLKAQGPQSENPEDIASFFKYFKSLDEKVIDYGLSNSLTIFKKKYDESQRGILVDLLYNRCVKPSVGQDGTVYPDKITLKVMKTLEGLPDVLVFKDSPKPIKIETWDELQNIIPKGSPIKVIMQPRLYFVNGKMGINFRVLQIKLQNIEKIGRPSTYAFSDSPVTVFTKSENTTEKVSAPDSKEKEKEEEVVNDSEEEEEDEEGSGSEVEVEDN